MSQEQPRKTMQGEPIKYGDVFAVQGHIAEAPVASQDAAMMQTAENKMLGKTVKGGAASVMQSAATLNEQAGFVGHRDLSEAAEEGVTITETDVPGRRFITETVGDQVVGEYDQPAPFTTTAGTEKQGGDLGITIGEALEAVSISAAGEKPVGGSDAAAIEAAEMRATGRNTLVSGGVGAAAQSAAAHNARVMSYEDKTKLADVLSDATEKLPSDKPATRKDVEQVVAAEMRNDPELSTYPGGIAASVAAAARLNQMND